MLPIGGKPLLERNIVWLRKFGVRELIINLYHLPQAVIDYFGDGTQWDVMIKYSIEEELLGTAGGVKNVAWFFDETFILWYGDNLCTCNLERMWRFHQSKGGITTMALFSREDPTASGIVGLDGNDRIQLMIIQLKPLRFGNIYTLCFYIWKFKIVFFNICNAFFTYINT